MASEDVQDWGRIEGGVNIKALENYKFLGGGRKQVKVLENYKISGWCYNSNFSKAVARSGVLSICPPPPVPTPITEAHFSESETYPLVIDVFTILVRNGTSWSMTCMKSELGNRSKQQDLVV